MQNYFRTISIKFRKNLYWDLLENMCFGHTYFRKKFQKNQQEYKLRKICNLCQSFRTLESCQESNQEVHKLNIFLETYFENVFQTYISKLSNLYCYFNFPNAVRFHYC